ncbi:hypothetical protein BSL78_29853 [Apostichopus japonicus]|uniref:Uncharacterized protein n=1 Tax=Stichopus japonicus TaxID=307972 RepID=A0A2G8JC69_STIJA|nr:hypothetical protein BSL78_29853 [Apostichopus japonicus]
MAGQETRLADQGACPRQPGHLARLPAQAVLPDPRPTGPDRSALPAERPKPPAQLVATWMTPPSLGDAADSGINLAGPEAFRPALAQSSRYSRSSRVHGHFSIYTRRLGPDKLPASGHASRGSLYTSGATRSNDKEQIKNLPQVQLMVDKLLEEDRLRTVGQKCKEESKGFSTMQGTSETWALVAREVRPKDS